MSTPNLTKLFSSNSKSIYIKFSPLNYNNVKSIKKCVDCKHFHKEQMTDDVRMGKCSLFGEMDPVSGIVRYSFASDVRQSIKDDSCGFEARYFTPSSDS